jgi:hypothetical protein
MAAGVGAYILVVRGALALDLGVGRRLRPLGPMHMQVAADPEIVFDVIAAPYLRKTPRAMQDKLEVLERGTDMVLAAHFTPVVAGMTATTVETVRFERPHLVAFYLVRGPVPHVRETFRLEPAGDGAVGTEFIYSGELGADLWAVGEWWAARVARSWEHAVERSMEAIKAEAERIASRSQSVARSAAGKLPPGTEDSPE